MRKKLKIPKSLGACADLLFQLKTERLAAQKVADDIEADEKAIKAYIIDNLPKGDTGASGKTHKVQTYVDTIPQSENWEEFYEYVKKNNAFDLLQRRLSDVAIRERIADGKKIPGIKMFPVVKVSLTKI